MLTIRDLAKRAGVSVATVSRVLNNYPDVSEETKQKVLALVQETNFRPSNAARSLVTRRSNIIGVFFLQDHMNSMVIHPFFQEVVVSFKRAVGTRGYDLLFFTSQKPGDGDFTYLKRCRHHAIDGVVLMGANRTDPQMAELTASGIPCMSVDVDMLGSRAGYVMSNNQAGARQAVRHLANLGHKRIALINGHPSSRPGYDRLIGYQEAMAEAGLPFRQDHVKIFDFTWQYGYEAMQELLNLPEPPTAVFAAADLVAMGAIKAIRERGLHVPEDIAMVGFDDVEVASMVHPALTTVAQDKDGLGRVAGENLVRLIEDPSFTPPIITLPTELVIRESCGIHLKK
ncbi:MAG TPA: LacI family DNA-binding transcriptional regulator [Symbiobacteriaceae bacterium]|nr:LacI family DNA-binding transcriptional regulator [Symbiobacteriaceae bacterium]